MVRPVSQIPQFVYGDIGFTHEEDCSIFLMGGVVIDGFVNVDNDYTVGNAVINVSNNPNANLRSCYMLEVSPVGKSEDSTKIFCASNKNKAFGGKFVLYREDGSIIRLKLPGYPSYVDRLIFKEGACTTIEGARKIVDRLLENGMSYGADYLLYSGYDSEKAQYAHSKIESELKTTEVEVSPPTADHATRTLYTVRGFIIWDTEKRLDIYDDSLLYKFTGSVYATYPYAKNVYKSFEDGTSKADKDLPEDEDFRFCKFSIDGSEFYLQNSYFKEKRETYDLDAIKCKPAVKKNIKLGRFMINAYVKSINPVVYSDLEVLSDDDVQDDLSVFAVKTGTNFSVIDVQQLVEMAKAEPESGYKAVGTSGAFGKAYLFHVGESTLRVANINNTFYKIAENGDSLFKERYDGTYDTFTRKLVLPKIFSGKDIISIENKIYTSKRRLKSLQVSAVYAENHKDTYKPGSADNKYAPGNPAMSLLDEIEVKVLKTASDPYDVQYSYELVDKDGANKEKNRPFVETMGYVLITDGTAVTEKKIMRDSEVDSVLDLFVDDSDSGLETVTEAVGVIMSPLKEPGWKR